VVATGGEGGLSALRIALERAGVALPADEPVLDRDEPFRGKVEWVTRAPSLPVQRRPDWDYDPFSPRRL
jgi:hypothetical protein